MVSRGPSWWQVRALFCTAVCLWRHAGAAGDGGAATAIVSSASSAHVQHFDVVFEGSVLGLQLSPEMIVSGFAPSGATGAQEFIRVGDTVVSVNGKNIRGLPSPRALDEIRSASLPKTLRFLSYGSIKRDSGRVDFSSSAVPPSSASAVPDTTVMPVLRILDVEIGLVSQIEFSNALFGLWAGASESCQPYHIVFAEPAHACTALTALSNEKIFGKIAVVNRGSCSFLSKAWQVFQHGAVGVVVLNSDDGLVAMPAESEALAEGLNIPVVMVRNSGAEELKNAAASGFMVQMYNPKLCSTHDTYGLYDNVIASMRSEIDESIKLEVDANGEPASATSTGDVSRQGGVIFFSSPSAAPKGKSKYSSSKADFLQFRSGPRALPKGTVRVVWATPPGGCGTLANTLTKDVKSFILVERGHGCSFADKIGNAEHAGAAGIIIVNDVEHGMTHGSAAAISARSDTDHSIPAVMITRSAARSLRVLSYSSSVVHCKLVLRQKVPVLWAELSKLGHANSWPRSEKDRRALYKRLAKVHHPDKGSGSVERFEWLRFQYRSLSAGADLE